MKKYVSFFYFHFLFIFLLVLFYGLQMKILRSCVKGKKDAIEKCQKSAAYFLLHCDTDITVYYTVELLPLG